MHVTLVSECQTTQAYQTYNQIIAAKLWLAHDVLPMAFNRMSEFLVMGTGIISISSLLSLGL